MSIRKGFYYSIRLAGSEVCRALVTAIALDGSQVTLKVCHITDPEFHACGFRVGNVVDVSTDRVRFYPIPIARPGKETKADGVHD